MKRYKNCGNCLLILIIAALHSIPVLAIENDSPNKIADHQEDPILNNDNTIVGSTPISSPGSGSENTVEQQAAEGCYCDVRKRRQVEKRLKEIEELKQ